MLLQDNFSQKSYFPFKKKYSGDVFNCQLGKQKGSKQEGRIVQWLPHFPGYFSPGLSPAAQGAAVSL